MTEQLLMSPEAFEKVQAWEKDGRQVYEASCVNLACLRHFFTPNRTNTLCPVCGSLMQKKQFSAIKSSDAKVKEYVPEKITKEDLEISVDWKGTILLNIHQHWRPIKIGYVSTGDEWQDLYHSMRYGMSDPEESRAIIQSIEDGSYIDVHWEELQEIVKQFGFELVDNEES